MTEGEYIYNTYINVFMLANKSYCGKHSFVVLSTKVHDKDLKAVTSLTCYTSPTYVHCTPTNIVGNWLRLAFSAR